ncbi:MAG: hypothetical protein WC755_00150 [Candidatus Woesearchaeota archaeon]|jgi:hypothetical protein
MNFKKPLLAALLVLVGCSSNLQTLKTEDGRTKQKISTFRDDEHFIGSGISKLKGYEPVILETYDNPKNQIIIRANKNNGSEQFYVRTDALSIPASNRLYKLKDSLYTFKDEPFPENVMYGAYIKPNLEGMVQIFRTEQLAKTEFMKEIAKIDSAFISGIDENKKEVLSLMKREYENKIKFNETVATIHCNCEKHIGYRNADPFDFLGNSSIWTSEEDLIMALENDFKKEEIRAMLKRDYKVTTELMSLSMKHCDLLENQSRKYTIGNP